MKTSQKLRALLLASFLTGGSTYAADPQPAPDVQALVTLLNKLVADAGIETEAPTPATQALLDALAPLVSGQKATPPAQQQGGQGPQGGLRMSTLSTGSLSGASLAPTSRLSNEDWRALFTSRSTTK
jgi:hypothetical protein